MARTHQTAAKDAEMKKNASTTSDKKKRTAPDGGFDQENRQNKKQKIASSSASTNKQSDKMEADASPSPQDESPEFKSDEKKLPITDQKQIATTADDAADDAPGDVPTKSAAAFQAALGDIYGEPLTEMEGLFVCEIIEISNCMH